MSTPKLTEADVTEISPTGTTENVFVYKDDNGEVKEVVFAKPESFDELINMSLKLSDGSSVVVTNITPSRVEPTKFEVNGNHLVSMLDVYSQFYSESVSEEELSDFNNLASITIDNSTKEVV